jgi:hypothetical protein
MIYSRPAVIAASCVAALSDLSEVRYEARNTPQIANPHIRNPPQSWLAGYGLP